MVVFEGDVDSDNDVDSEDDEDDSDDGGDDSDSDSDNSSVSSYLKHKLDNYRSNIVDDVLETSEPIDMDTVEGIKSILESNNIPLIWKSLKQLVEEHSIRTK